MSHVRTDRTAMLKQFPGRSALFGSGIICQFDVHVFSEKESALATTFAVALANRDASATAARRSSVRAIAQTRTSAVGGLRSLHCSPLLVAYTKSRQIFGRDVYAARARGDPYLDDRRERGLRAASRARAASNTPAVGERRHYQSWPDSCNSQRERWHAEVSPADPQLVRCAK